MRIFIVIPSLFGGGAEKQSLFLAKELSTFHEVFIFYYSGLSYSDYYNSNNMQCIKISKYFVIRELQLFCSIKRFSPNVVYSWLGISDISIGLLHFCFKRRVHWIVAERSSEKAYPPTFFNYLRCFLVRYSDLIISNSEKGKEYWIKKGLVNVVVINNILDIQIGFFNNRKIDHNKLVCVGRLVESKGIMITLNFYLKLLLEFPLLTLDIYGDGILLEKIENFIHQNSLKSKIKVFSYLPNWYKNYSQPPIFVSLSQFEGMSNSYLESLGLGLFCIVSNISEHKFRGSENLFSINFCDFNFQEFRLCYLNILKNECFETDQNYELFFEKHSMKFVFEQYQKRLSSLK